MGQACEQAENSRAHTIMGIASFCQSRLPFGQIIQKPPKKGQKTSLQTSFQFSENLQLFKNTIRFLLFAWSVSLFPSERATVKAGCQGWLPKYSPQDPRDGGRELTPARFPLTSTCTRTHTSNFTILPLGSYFSFSPHFMSKIPTSFLFSVV